MSELAPSLSATMTSPHLWSNGPHPWRRYREEYPHVAIHWRDLGPGVHALTDGVRNVWHAKKSLQVDRRYSARHEQEHLDQGHDGCVKGIVEDRVHWRTAKWLVPNPHDVASAMIEAGGNVPAAADLLWLPERGMRARLDLRFMHPAERVLIQRKILDELHP